MPTNDSPSDAARRVAALLTFAAGFWAGYSGIVVVTLNAIAGVFSRSPVATSMDWYLAFVDAASFLLMMLAAPLAALLAPRETRTRAVFALIGACCLVLGAVHVVEAGSAAGALGWTLALGAIAWGYLTLPREKALPGIYLAWSLTIGFVGSSLVLATDLEPLLVAVWIVLTGAALGSAWLLLKGVRRRSTASRR